MPADSGRVKAQLLAWIEKNGEISDEAKNKKQALVKW